MNEIAEALDLKIEESEYEYILKMGRKEVERTEKEIDGHWCDTDIWISEWVKTPEAEKAIHDKVRELCFKINRDFILSYYCFKYTDKPGIIHKVRWGKFSSGHNKEICDVVNLDKELHSFEGKSEAQAWKVALLWLKSKERKDEKGTSTV